MKYCEDKLKLFGFGKKTKIKSNVLTSDKYIAKIYTDDFCENLKKANIFSELGLSPMVVNYFDCYQGDKRVNIIIYEKLYKTFSEIIDENKELPKKFLHKLIDVLYKAYSNGLYYYDLWDENIMIDKKGNVYLIDLDDAVIGPKLNKKEALQNTANIMYLTPSFDRNYLFRMFPNNKSKNDYIKLILAYFEKKYNFIPSDLNNKLKKIINKINTLNDQVRQKKQLLNRFKKNPKFYEKLKNEIDELYEKIEINIIKKEKLESEIDMV